MPIFPARAILMGNKDEKRKRSATRDLKRLNTVGPDGFLHRNSVWWFVAFSAFALWAFWPSYFSQPLRQPEVRLHLHGIAMALWCVMLIAQAYLIRTGLKQTHRLIGKASYALVPFIVLATINLVHFRMKGAGTLSNMSLYMMALMLNAVVVFAALYALAMYHRHRPALHARYMVCTVFPLFTPVTDRLIFGHFPSLIGMVPVLDGSPLVQVVGFLLADILLLALTIWDWRANRRKDAFPIALGLLVIYQVSVLTFYRIPLWKSFGEWFAKLPLS
jgi:hypothetical protein